MAYGDLIGQQRAANVPAYGLGGTSAPLAPPTPSRIRDGLNALEGGLTELHGLLNSLESRLDTVLTAIPPAPAANGIGKETAGSSHLDQRVQQANAVLGHALARVNDLLNRIEV